MAPLPSINRVAPVFFTAHFLITLVITIVLTCGINAIIDYFMNRDKAPYDLINKNTAPNVLIFCLIIGLLAFFGGGEVHKRIKAGKAEPVRRFALQDNFVKRFIFFPISEPNWKCRLPLFLWWCVMVPGVVILIALYLFCWISKGFGEMHTNDCTCTLAEFVIWTELWKGFGASVITAVNYAAAHNDEQKELQESLTDAATADVMVTDTESSQLYYDAPNGKNVV